MLLLCIIWPFPINEWVVDLGALLLLEHTLSYLYKLIDNQFVFIKKIQVASDLKEKLEKCEAESEASRKANERNLLPLSSFTTDVYVKLHFHEQHI